MEFQFKNIQPHNIKFKFNQQVFRTKNLCSLKKLVLMVINISIIKWTFHNQIVTKGKENVLSNTLIIVKLIC